MESENVVWKLFEEELLSKAKVMKQGTPFAIPYLIIKSYMKLENPDEVLIKRFQQWFLNGHNVEGKEIALKLIFDETLSNED